MAAIALATLETTHDSYAPELPLPIAPAPSRCEYLARLIHDDVLQTLGVALLESELSRRFWGRGQDDQVFAGLDAVAMALETVVGTTGAIADDLRAIETRPAQSADRALPLWVRANLEPDGSVWSDPSVTVDEIRDTLSVCLLQTELCRRQFRNGAEQPALRELTILLQRLEMVVEQFRTVMQALRQPQVRERTEASTPLLLVRSA